MQTDEELMAAYVAGDAGAFRALFDRYAPMLLRMLRRQVASDADARDLVQLAFLHLHRARLDFREGSRVRPWLVTIALNAKREHFRRTGRRRETTLEPERARGEGISSSDQLVAGEEAKRVRAALASLPDNQREVIELHWFEGLPFAEIADAVGANVSAVKVRAHRGYERLRMLLKETSNPGASGNVLAMAEPGDGLP